MDLTSPTRWHLNPDAPHSPTSPWTDYTRTPPPAGLGTTITDTHTALAMTRKQLLTGAAYHEAGHAAVYTHHQIPIGSATYYAGGHNGASASIGLPPSSGPWQGYAIGAAAGHRAEIEWMRRTGLLTPTREWAAERHSDSDRKAAHTVMDQCFGAALTYGAARAVTPRSIPDVGNVTASTNWLLPGTPLTTRLQYDIAGNVVSSTDPRNNTTQFFFEDNFGVPADGNSRFNAPPAQLNGQQSYALITRVVNAALHTSFTQYDPVMMPGWIAKSVCPSAAVRYWNSAVNTPADPSAEFDETTSDAAAQPFDGAVIDPVGDFAYFEGRIVPFAEATISVATHALNYGTAIFEGITVIFLAEIFGIDLSIPQMAIVMIMSVITAIGAAGVPGGSTPTRWRSSVRATSWGALRCR